MKRYAAILDPFHRNWFKVVFWRQVNVKNLMSPFVTVILFGIMLMVKDRKYSKMFGINIKLHQ